MSRAATNVSVSDCRVDVRLLAVAGDLRGGDPARAVLAADDVAGDVCRCAGDRPQDLDLLVAQRVGLERRRRLHRDQADQLEQVVLEDVARRAGLLVERAAVLDADRLGHGDLHVVDVAPVPERLEDAVAEPEDQQVADGLLAQVVVDAVDLRLAEDLADLAVEPLRRVEVVPERLLDDDPAPAAVVLLVVEPDPAELGDDLGELRRLGGEVEQAVAARAVLLVERRRAASASASNPAGSAKSQALVADPLGERPPGVLVDRQDAAELVERRPDLGPERLVVVRPPADGQERRTRAAAGSSATAGRAPG